MKKGVGCLLAFLVFALLVSVGFNFLQFASNLGIDGASVGPLKQHEKFTEILEDGSAKSHDKIVRIDLEGLIASGSSEGILGSVSMDVDGIKRALAQAAADTNVKAIV